MSREVVRDRQEGFKGGLNLVADESQLAPNEVRLATNVRLTDDGGATARSGTQKITSVALESGTAILGGYSWTNSSGVQQILVVVNGKLYYGSYAVPATFTLKAGALSSSTRPSFASFRTPTATAMVYIADGGLLNSYDGTTFTVDIASTPSVSVLAVYNSRLFGISGTDENLYWSALDNGSTLGITGSAGGVAAVRTFGRQRLCGLAALGSSLLLFHERGISRFTGVSIDDISILSGARGVSQDVGTIAPNSIVTIEDACYFASDRGFYKVTESGVESISRKIDPVVTILASADLALVRGVHSRATREVWFYLPAYGVYVYNYRTGAWAGPWNGDYIAAATAVQTLFEAVDVDGKSIVLAGCADGYVRRCDTGALDSADSTGAGGTSFTVALRCHRMFAGDTAAEKSLRRIYVLADLKGSTSASIQWRLLTATGSAFLVAPPAALWGAGTWGTFLWGGAGATSQGIEASGRGNWVEVTLIDSGNTAALYSSVEIECFNMGRR